MTDTAGYSDIMFGCYRILDFQLSPRLADSGGARFWKLDPLADYSRLNAIATNLIDRAVIELCYDDILRVGGSLLQRQTTGSELMRAPKPHPPPRHARPRASRGRARAEDHPPARLLQRPDLPPRDPRADQPRRGAARTRTPRLPRQQGRAPTALPARPGRADRSARLGRQLHRALQHDLYPASARPAHRRGIRDPARRHPAPITARARAHPPHRPIPHRPYRDDPARRIPTAKDAGPRRSRKRLDRVSVPTIP